MKGVRQSSTDLPFIDKTQKIFYGVRGLILKHHSDDPSGVKEAYGYDLAHRFGLMVPYYTFAKVIINVNGTPYNFGLYQVYEPLDKQFIRLRFSGSSSYLFKCLWNDGGPATLTTTDYIRDVDIGLEKKDPATPAEAATWNPQPSYNPTTMPSGRPWTPTYDLKAKENDIVDARTALDALIQGITTRENSAFDSWITTVLDVESFLKGAALNAVLAQWDVFCRHENNYYLLYRPSDHKWIFIPTIWITPSKATTSMTDRSAGSPTGLCSARKSWPTAPGPTSTSNISGI
jgi:spore coat protein CotH